MYDASRQQFIREDGSWSPFESIVHSGWWCLVTMTTVGYGDAYPVTLPGKLVGVSTMFVGLVVLSLPITIVMRNFDNEWQASLRDKDLRIKAREEINSEGLANPSEQQVDERASLCSWQIEKLVQDEHKKLLDEIDVQMKKAEEQLRESIKDILERADAGNQRRPSSVTNTIVQPVE